MTMETDKLKSTLGRSGLTERLRRAATVSDAGPNDGRQRLQDGETAPPQSDRAPATPRRRAAAFAAAMSDASPRRRACVGGADDAGAITRKEGDDLFSVRSLMMLPLLLALDRSPLCVALSIDLPSRSLSLSFSPR